jgi:acyl phosphate:glycerol-3-phosphate acyltransferase
MFLLVVCYLLGALPFGQWVGYKHGVDLTQQGSGNTGAANAARTLGAKAGLMVLGLDLAKGLVAVALAYVALLPWPVFRLSQIVFGLAAIVGHNYSIFRKFKGGKGIATTFGVLLALNPKVFALSGLLWISMVGLTRFSSVGSLTATAAMPVLLVVYRAPWEYVLFGFLAAGLAFWRHKENIERLADGSEHKIEL